MIRVLIVDDSAIVRKVISEDLSGYEDIEVIGTAADAYAARDKIVKRQPDVITLDLEMPRMDGLSFLAKLMEHYPMPVVVLSSLTPKNSENALRALDLGAVDVLSKPGGSCPTRDRSQNLARAIRAAAAARIKKYQPRPLSAAERSEFKNLVIQTNYEVIAIGSSTGGTKAIEAVLSVMPSSSPGIVIAQHMPENFTSSFAKRLNSKCQIEVREASDNDCVMPGLALIAPGNRHMLFNRGNGKYRVRIKAGPKVHFQRPSVDVLFQSVAQTAAQNAVGVLLTGMGADGAKGMLAMKDAGAYTMVQDEKTCVVFGMPKEAIKLGAVDKIVALMDIPRAILCVLKDREASQ